MFSITLSQGHFMFKIALFHAYIIYVFTLIASKYI